MTEKILFEDLRKFAYSNDHLIEGEINAVIIAFSGLNSVQMYEDDAQVYRSDCYAKKGIVCLIPYHNPWAWMNDLTVKFADQIIDVIIDQYNLPRDLPIVSTGSSMGGQQALTFTAYSTHNIVGCVVNCPVCDVPVHYTERTDLPRTFQSALAHYDMPFDEALESISPYHICVVGKLPKIQYYFFLCDKDELVDMERHSVKMIELLNNRGYDVGYHIVHDRGHCSLDEESGRKFTEIATALAEAKG